MMKSIMNIEYNYIYIMMRNLAEKSGSTIVWVVLISLLALQIALSISDVFID